MCVCLKVSTVQLTGLCCSLHFFGGVLQQLILLLHLSCLCLSVVILVGKLAWNMGKLSDAVPQSVLHSPNLSLVIDNQCAFWVVSGGTCTCRWCQNRDPQSLAQLVLCLQGNHGIQILCKEKVKLCCESSTSELNHLEFDLHIAHLHTEVAIFVILFSLGTVTP